MISDPLVASGIIIDPASIMQTWWNTNHWAGITAASMFTTMVIATWRMPQIQNETKAQMVSDLFKMGRYLVGILLLIEFYDFIVSVIIDIVELVT